MEKKENFCKLMHNLLINKIFKKGGILLLGVLFSFSLLLLPHTTEAAMLTPGNIATCGELGISGEYILTADLTTSGTSTCFSISSDNVTINGNGHSITGNGTNNGSIAIDARARVGGPSGILDEGMNGYTNLIIANLNITNFTTGIDTSGNNNTTGVSVRAGNGGDGGDIAVSTSTVGSIYAMGGNSTTVGYGGTGGNVYITNNNLDISNGTIDLRGGTGTTGRNTDGGLTLSYTGALTRTNLVLSPLAFLKDNATTYTNYIGGTWPVAPSTISSCGTLATPGTYVLSSDIGSIESPITSTCFTIGADDVTIDGGGHTIYGSSTDNFFIEASTYGSTTIASTTVTGYSKLINSTKLVTITSPLNLNISNQYIKAGSLTLSYTNTINFASTTISALTDLIVNGTSYGSQLAGGFPDRGWVQKTSDVARSWYSVASSADGKKLVALDASGGYGGYVYTSTDSGNTWVQQTSSGVHYWISVTSSADGTKLAAVEYNGYIYTSSDSGNTWVKRRDSATNYWNDITSSADGTKLAAASGGASQGPIFISTDSGLTWKQSSSITTYWYSITSSADGTKLAAVNSGYIYTSTDSGNTWAQKTFDVSRYWQGIASSADGVRLVAVVGRSPGGYIYTSTDSGNTWVQKTFDATRNWNGVTCDASCTKITAVASDGYIYSSTDSGNTWMQQIPTGLRNWRSITSSADGTKLVAASSYLYRAVSFAPQLNVDILSPVSSSTINQWSPYVSWGTATECYYSYDNFVSTSTANCSLNGSDIPIPLPLIGTSTLSVTGIDAQGSVVTKQSTFRYNLGVFISSPIIGINYSWTPNINWNVNNVATGTLSCYYSYNNFTSTSTADCNLSGSDIIAPADGAYTLYAKVVDESGNVGASNVGFTLATNWIKAVDGLGNLKSIASSYDGKKLAAVSGYIYTSTDSGNTWVQRTSAGAFGWTSIASSADGTKLVATVGSKNGPSGYIYTSNDSGDTWVQHTSAGLRAWMLVTSSADGSKLAAVVYNGYIYTSTDFGNTWIQKTFDATRYWNSIASSVDGTKLIAAASNSNYLYTSIDSGNTWVQQTSAGLRSWYSVASSADGTKLAAVVWNGYIYTSIDSGNTWVQQTSSGSRYWSSIASSVDGVKLVAADGGSPGYIYIYIREFR